MNSYFFIPLIICIILTLFVFTFISYPCSEPKEPRNKVHFYVTKDFRYHDHLLLWLGKPKWNENVAEWVKGSIYVTCLHHEYGFKYYNLNPDDFANMKGGEIREVYLDFEH